MQPTTRLDPVLKIRSDAELNAARRRLAQAVAEREAAVKAADAARARLVGSAHIGGAAWMVDVIEVGHRRSMEELERAEEHAHAASAFADTAREAQVDAKQKMKVIERVIEERKLAVLRERERKEQREQDERSAASFAR